MHFIFLGFVGSALFVHSCPTLAQQGLFGASLVSFPYSAPKTAHRAYTSFSFSAHSSSTFPLRGKAGLLSQLAPANLHEFDHNWLTRLQQALFGTSLVLLLYSSPKTAHRAAQGRVWFHRFFGVRFCFGRAAKSRSILYSTASWMGRIV